MKTPTGFRYPLPQTCAGFALLLSTLASTSTAQTGTANTPTETLSASTPLSGSSFPDSTVADASRLRLTTTVPSGGEGPAYGGDHEVGFIAGYSGVSGPIWGYRKDVQYSLVTARYSFLMLATRRFTLRYSPEITVGARLDEPVLSNADTQIGRQHTYGGGISPVGFQFTASQRTHVQPFVGMNGGMIYFNDRVLSPQGSQFMYTIDFGGGVNLFVTPRKAITVGYRYQHLSNANISLHNPGTDADTFYIGASWFHTHGLR